MNKAPLEIRSVRYDNLPAERLRTGHRYLLRLSRNGAARSVKPSPEPTTLDRLVISGTVDGPAGPLRHWPFRLLQGDHALAPRDLGNASTENEFRGGVFWTDAGGHYYFDGITLDGLSIEVVEPGDLPAVGADVPGVIEGVIDGPSGPLRNWPFRLLRNGKPVTDLELGREGSCANQFKRDCWWTDCAGRYRFERMMGDSYSIEVL